MQLIQKRDRIVSTCFNLHRTALQYAFTSLSVLFRRMLILLQTSVDVTQTKKEAHRFYAVLTQLNVKSCELHGDVTQALRYLALQRFRDNEVDVMVRDAVHRDFIAMQSCHVVLEWFLHFVLENFSSTLINQFDKNYPVQVCTDVAARGLDIPGVQTVINAEMPRSAST